MIKSSRKRRLITSLGIILASLGITYAPIPGVKQTVTIVSGTELAAPLQELEARFERDNSQIELKLKFQGSQDIVNNLIEGKNNFTPAIIIPANHVTLDELKNRFLAQNNSEPFYETPKPIAKTILVGIAWEERGEVLFPDDKFRWSAIERAMQLRNWSKISGADWGSFDLRISDPLRSNSSQLALSLWTKNNPSIALFSAIKSSVYQPPRSTDILLQEFISRGANDGDVAVAYESIALHRWVQAKTTQGKPYKIYYPNPTIETTATAAILRQNVEGNTASSARKFVNFLTKTPQQEIFVKYGFRPVSAEIDLSLLTDSPWSDTPGAMVQPQVQIEQPPTFRDLTEIQRFWNQAE